MKFGKKIKLDIDNPYKTQYGTVENKNFKSTYITLSCWAEPNQEEENWPRIIKDLRREVRKELHQQVNRDIFKEEKSIIDLDIRASGIKVKKRSFLNCELTLFVKPGTPFKSNNLKTSVEGIFTGLIKNVFTPYKHFKFYPTKS